MHASRAPWLHPAAGVLAHFCRLRTLRLRSFASVDLSRLPASVQQVEINPSKVEMMWRSLGETAQAHRSRSRALLAEAGRRLAAAEAVAESGGEASEALAAARGQVASARAAVTLAAAMSVIADRPGHLHLVQSTVTELFAALASARAAQAAANAAAAVAPAVPAMLQHDASQAHAPAADEDPLAAEVAQAALGVDGFAATLFDLAALDAEVAQQVDQWTLEAAAQGILAPIAVVSRAAP